MFNHPNLWRAKLPVPAPDGHKYARGHAVVLGGSVMTGAARLASMAAMRMGAGLCTIVAAKDAALVYQTGAPHILYEPLDGLQTFAAHLRDPRRNAVLMGPGAGQDDADGLRRAVLQSLIGEAAFVLDADALTVFSGRNTELFHVVHENCVLTPHEGEFEKLFGKLPGNREERAVEAAKQSGAIVLLKGERTVIAHPKGRFVVNDHASPWLATAGAGDVLAGIILGLLAQKMDAFDAACAAAWIHGDAARRHGPGLVSPDLIDSLPVTLRDLME